MALWPPQDYTGSGLQVLQTSPTIITPTIASFANATHDHADAAGGGQIDHTNLTNIGSNSHATIDSHIADGTLHFTEASIDHGSIAGLTDDDHTGYALLAGRSGGQILRGGTAAGDDLDLRASSASDYTGSVLVGKGAGDYAASPAIALEIWPDGITHQGFGAGTIAAVYMNSNITQDTGGLLGLPLTQLFGDFHVRKPASASITNLGTDISFVSYVDVNNDTSGNVSCGVKGFDFRPRLISNSSGNLQNFSTIPVTGVSLSAQGVENSTGNVTITEFRGIDFMGTSGAGVTVTEDIALHIRDSSTASTMISVESLDADRTLRHLGAGVFGSSSAPTASATLEVAGTGGAFLLPRLTVAQRGSLTPANGMLIYQTDSTPGVYAYVSGAWGKI